MQGILSHITGHHHDEIKQVEDALPTQKLRVSIERRIHNMEVLVFENVPESPEKHQALADIRTARQSLEKMLNKMDEADSE